MRRPQHTFSVLCAQVTATLEATETLGQRMTGVRYSRLRPALLGTACESGRVSFWDWYIKHFITQQNCDVKCCIVWASVADS